MLQNMQSQQMLLYRARLLLEEGQYEAVSPILERVQCEDEKQHQELSYLKGWYYIQRKQWDAAIEALEPLLEQHVKDLETGEQETPAERERLVLYLLRLGIAAVNLCQYEDASQHFSLCLKVLHDRRVHLPAVRIKARYSLAMTCLVRGLYPAAVQHYEEALRLCRHYDNEEEVPHIQHGLCDAYRYTGELTRARDAGYEALRLYEQRRDPLMEARMHNKLGHICLLLSDFHRASDHYTESLAIATGCDAYTMVMLNCAALADLRLAEERVGEARRYCTHALSNMKRTDDVHMRGTTYYIVGKVAYEEACRAEDKMLRRRRLEEAIECFTTASEYLEQTQAYPDRAKVYSSWAQALEDLDRAEEAIDCWRAGYKMLSHTASSEPVI
jgi:tetratricopeptide (TPR) repeat protein